MAKQLKATLVGVFIVAGVILFVVLYTWFSGRLSLRNTYDIVVHFDDVIGLRVGDPVMILGLEKGKVKDLKIDGVKIRAVFAIERDVVLPRDSKIAIRSMSYVGSDRYVKIIPGRAEETADVFYGESEALDLDAMATEFDSLLVWIRNLKVDGLDLNKIAKKLSRDIDESVKEIAGAVKGSTVKIEHLAERLDSLTALLSGDGTVGKMIKSDDLYEEVRETNQALKTLIEDIKENPDRYINVKVF